MGDVQSTGVGARMPPARYGGTSRARNKPTDPAGSVSNDDAGGYEVASKAAKTTPMERITCDTP